jgi:hypothetical protein
MFNMAIIRRKNTFEKWRFLGVNVLGLIGIISVAGFQVEACTYLGPMLILEAGHNS